MHQRINMGTDLQDVLIFLNLGAFQVFIDIWIKQVQI